MNGASWRLRRSPQRSRTSGGELVGRDDAGRHRVLEVVADVGDAVGPGHDLALGRGRRRPGPRVVADAVERLDAQVERGRARRRPPTRRGRSPRRGRGVKASSLAWPPGPWPQSWPRAMASVRATLRPSAPGDGGGDLGHLEGVGQPGALVVVGEDEHLGLAGQAPEGGGVQDAVAVALEAGAHRVGLLGDGPPAGAVRPGGRRAPAARARPPRARTRERDAEPADGGGGRRDGPGAPGPHRRGRASSTWPRMVAAQRRSARSVGRTGGRSGDDTVTARSYEGGVTPYRLGRAARRATMRRVGEPIAPARLVAAARMSDRDVTRQISRSVVNCRQ